MTLPSRRVGAIFLPDLPPERLRDYAQAAEAAGVDELWLWEDCFREGGVLERRGGPRLDRAAADRDRHLADAAAQRRDRRDGDRDRRAHVPRPADPRRRARRAVVDGSGRRARRLAADADARVRAGAARPARRRERDDVGSLRARSTQVQLDWPPTVAPPVLAAAEGPKTLALTGEVADGTVLTGGTTVGAGRGGARAASRRAGRRPGRDGHHEVVVYVAVAFGADAAARAAVQLEDWGHAGRDRPHPGRRRRRTSPRVSPSSSTPERMPSSCSRCTNDDRPRGLPRAASPRSRAARELSAA